ncbi:FAD-dependent monooxygenase [Kutzneria sp. CA-103260]|uniref:FAD-dependent monooxygenase n=1 Tax=Kutzneria sp. CA-103260 TaxID=2802641 RepID=UPI001BA62A92|nr:FAD-dependent monooxygenase [Kutzneria sp. CA-103260]QUQ69380.1 FAD-dependent oxidoreductase [Kutzneria sp. CA-103260]
MTKNILVSGASIAGPALAYWLREHGYTVTVVERAPAPRPGGYKIDVRGRAMEVLERMGLVDEVRRHHTDMRGGAFVDRRGRTVVEMDADTVGFREPTDVEILRGDLARILLTATEGVEYVYGDSITALTEDERGVAVTFERSLPRRFDLVIGADGLHSAVRGLAFGPEERFLRSLGHHIAIFSVPNLLELDRWETIQAEKGRTLNVYSTRQDTEAKAAFMFASPDVEYGRRDTARQQQILAEVFAPHGWIAPQLLDAMPAAPDFFFDDLSVVEMESWSTGRVALVGDAAYGPSPASGQGTSLALVGAYVLAGELAAAGGDHKSAFAAYEQRMRHFVTLNQKQSSNIKRMVAGSRFTLWLNSTMMRLMPYLPGTSKIMDKVRAEIRDVSNAIDLPDYQNRPESRTEAVRNPF